MIQEQIAADANQELGHFQRRSCSRRAHDFEKVRSHRDGGKMLLLRKLVRHSPAVTEGGTKELAKVLASLMAIGKEEVGVFVPARRCERNADVTAAAKLMAPAAI